MTEATQAAARVAQVLLVEDNETIRRAFAFLLEESGYRVLTAATGGEALAAVTRERPDLVLLDLGLPDVHGLEVARHLKRGEETRDIVVVALTGRALEADLAACREAGCAGCFVKPVDTQRLLREIAELMGREQGIGTKG